MHLEKTESYRLLEGHRPLIAVHLHAHVASFPEFVEILALSLKQIRKPELLGSFKASSSSLSKVLVCVRRGSRGVVSHVLGKGYRFSLLGVNHENYFSSVVCGPARVGKIAVCLKRVLDSRCYRHLAVSGRVAENHARVPHVIQAGFKNAVLKPACPSRISSVALHLLFLVFFRIVFVVNYFRRYDYGGFVVENRYFVGYGGQVAVLHGNQSFRSYRYLFAREHFPYEVSLYHAVSHVEEPLEVKEGRGRYVKGLVVHVKLDYLRVRNVYYGLSHLREPEGFLSVYDGPRFVEAVYYGEVLVARVSLFEGAPHSYVAV